MKANQYAWTLVALLATGALAACGSDDPVEPVPIDAQLKVSLDETIQDAYRTYYTYEAVLDDFGPGVAPFASLAVTELSYVNALANLYRNRGATAPASVWDTDNVPHFANLREACMAAEEGELATGMMFERQLQANLPNDVRQTYEMQRSTARNMHQNQFRNCAGGAAVLPVDAAVQAAMQEAIQAEYTTYYTYSRVIADLGNVAPFLNVREAESMHIGAVANLYLKRDLTVPGSSSNLDNVPRYGTRQAACAGGVQAETDLIAMYNRLLAMTLPLDVQRVFENLQDASQDRHLPTFELCAS